MTYSQYFNDLNVMLENAIINYEYMTLTESTEDKSAMQKLKNAGKFIWAGLIKAAKLIAKIFEFCKKKIADLIAKFRKKDVVLKAGVDIARGLNTREKAPLIAINRAIVDKSYNANEAIKNIKNLSSKITLKKGEHVNLESMQKYNDYCAAMNKKVLDKLTEYESSNNSDKELMSNFQAVQKVFSVYATAVQSGVTAILNQCAADFSAADAVQNDEFTMGESVDTDAVSNNELAARCLIEAAQLLRESNDLPQDNIDEIPEEKPEVDDEYPEDTSGGDEMPADHMEDTKELIDNDKEAMDILTKDEDSKIITEAINLVFDI